MPYVHFTERLSGACLKENHFKESYRYKAEHSHIFGFSACFRIRKKYNRGTATPYCSLIICHCNERCWNLIGNKYRLNHNSSALYYNIGYWNMNFNIKTITHRLVNKILKQFICFLSCSGLISHFICKNNILWNFRAKSITCNVFSKNNRLKIFALRKDYLLVIKWRLKSISANTTKIPVFLSTFWFVWIKLINYMPFLLTNRWEITVDDAVCSGRYIIGTSWEKKYQYASLSGMRRQ